MSLYSFASFELYACTSVDGNFHVAVFSYIRQDFDKFTEVVESAKWEPLDISTNRWKSIPPSEWKHILRSDFTYAFDFTANMALFIAALNNKFPLFPVYPFKVNRKIITKDFKVLAHQHLTVSHPLATDYWTISPSSTPDPKVSKKRTASPSLSPIVPKQKSSKKTEAVKRSKAPANWSPPSSNRNTQVRKYQAADSSDME